MINIGIEFITALGGFFIGALTLYFSRIGAAKKDGADVAEMKRDILYIKEAMDEIKDNLKADRQRVDDSLRRVHERVDGMTKYIDDRISEHERKYHSG